MDREKDLKSEEEREALVKFQAGKYEGYYVWDVPPTYLANAYFNWRNISDEFKMKMLMALLRYVIKHSSHLSDYDMEFCVTYGLLFFPKNANMEWFDELLKSKGYV